MNYVGKVLKKIQRLPVKTELFFVGKHKATCSYFREQKSCWEADSGPDTWMMLWRFDFMPARSLFSLQYFSRFIFRFIYFLCCCCCLFLSFSHLFVSNQITKRMTSARTTKKKLFNSKPAHIFWKSMRKTLPKSSPNISVFRANSSTL